MSWLERLVGVSFVLSGLAKFFNFGEDISVTLTSMARANAGTRLAPLSDWLVQASMPVSIFVGLVMLVTGSAQVMQHRHAKWAAVIQLAMIVVFVTLLHRAFPVIFLDGLYVMALMPLAMTARAPETVRP